MIKDNLKKARLMSGLSQKKLAEQIGITQQAYARYEIGTSSPCLDMVVQIAEILGVSTESIIGGDQRRPSNTFTFKKKRFPLLGEIACGNPIYANEDHESFVCASEDIDADFCLKAKGDSMTGARIYDGDIVFIKATTDVPNGAIAAVVFEDGADTAEATLKRFYFDDATKTATLCAENPKYAPIVLAGDALNTVRILGRAVCATIRL